MAMFGSRRHEELAALRAEVDSAQARLAADISNLEAGQDPMSRQAMADAGERYTAAGSLLSTASTAGELMVAKRIVAEGLTATRLVRLHKLSSRIWLMRCRGIGLGRDLRAAE
jgi:hypothetical protein